MTQKELTKERLEDDVREVLRNIDKARGGIIFGPRDDKYTRKIRCHEIARLLYPELETRGYQNVVVKDGWVKYDERFLGCYHTGEFLKEPSSDEDGYEKEVRETFKEMFESIAQGEKITTSAYHSWCEVQDFVVDFHKRIDLSSV